MILEICANSFQSALNAQNAGAHRIELCSELSVGGITPSFGLLKKVAETLTIPVHVLIRPRSGDFCFSAEAFDIIKHDIQLCKELGFAGIVSGVLNTDNTIDLIRTKQLIALAKPLTFTFHRAFDRVPNPFEALKLLIDLGVDRILTSGQKSTAEAGIELLIQLNERANQQIILLPGSGINPENAALFKNAGFNEIHTSASKIIEYSSENDDYFENTRQTASDVSIIKAILKTIK